MDRIPEFDQAFNLLASDRGVCFPRLRIKSDLKNSIPIVLGKAIPLEAKQNIEEKKDVYDSVVNCAVLADYRHLFLGFEMQTEEDILDHLIFVISTFLPEICKQVSHYHRLTTDHRENPDNGYFHE